MRANGKKCRICLDDNSIGTIPLESLFDGKTYSEIYFIVTGYDANVRGPQYFCKKCEKQLREAYEFKQRCDRSEEILIVGLPIKLERLEEPEEQVAVETKPDPDSVVFVGNCWFDAEGQKQAEEYVKEESSDCQNDYNHSEESDSDADYGKPIEEKHTLRVVPCPYCPRKYKDQDNLRKHCRRSHLDQKQQCDECDVSFLLPYQLQRHKKTSHEKRVRERKKEHSETKTEKSICCHCGKIMAAHYLDRHINDVHLKSYVEYTCDLCQAKVHTKGGLISHMRRKHMDVQYECTFCKETFPSYGTRRTHELRFHTFAYKFSCNLCGHKFISNRDLRKHRVTHTGEKNFRCDICGLQVSRQSVLNLHQATHSDARPFVCDICSASFKTKKALRVHYGVHSERNYECPVCQQKFLVNQAMRLHVTKRHPDYQLPPPGTVMNKSALQRINEINAKYNVNYSTTPRVFFKNEPGALVQTKPLEQLGFNVENSIYRPTSDGYSESNSTMDSMNTVVQPPPQMLIPPQLMHPSMLRPPMTIINNPVMMHSPVVMNSPPRDIKVQETIMESLNSMEK